MSDDLSVYVQGKGWKDAGAAVESYRNLEKLQGVPADQLIRLPKPDDATGWEGVWNRLGRPSKPEDYQLAVPEGADPSFAKEFAGWLHANGIPKAAGQKIAQSLNERAMSLAKTQETEAATKLEADKASLKSKWGAAYDQNLALATKTGAEFGLKKETIDAIQKSGSYGEVMDFLASVGARFGEDAFVAPNSTPPSGFSGALTPGQAQAAIKAKFQDTDFMKRFRDGDARARAEWNSLNAYAVGQAPGQ